MLWLNQLLIIFTCIDDNTSACISIHIDNNISAYFSTAINNNSSKMMIWWQRLGILVNENWGQCLSLYVLAEKPSKMLLWHVSQHFSTTLPCHDCQLWHLSPFSTGIDDEALVCFSTCLDKISLLSHLCRITEKQPRK